MVVLFGRELGIRWVLNLVLKEGSREKSGRRSLFLSALFLEENILSLGKELFPSFGLQIALFPPPPH